MGVNQLYVTGNSEFETR